MDFDLGMVVDTSGQDGGAVNVQFILNIKVLSSSRRGSCLCTLIFLLKVRFETFQKISIKRTIYRETWTHKMKNVLFLLKELFQIPFIHLSYIYTIIT